MATQTTNYGLTKPSYNETADIGVINSNMDIIDAKMKAIENKAGGGGTSVTVDSELSTTSENPVQNKVITEQVSGLKSDLDNFFKDKFPNDVLLQNGFIQGAWTSISEKPPTSTNTSKARLRGVFEVNANNKVEIQRNSEDFDYIFNVYFNDEYKGSDTAWQTQNKSFEYGQGKYKVYIGIRKSDNSELSPLDVPSSGIRLIVDDAPVEIDVALNDAIRRIDVIEPSVEHIESIIKPIRCVDTDVLYKNIETMVQGGYGAIMTYSNPSPSNTNTRIRNEFEIQAKSIMISAKKDGYSFTYAVFKKDGTLISGKMEWSDSEVNVYGEIGYVRIAIRKNNNSQISISDFENCGIYLAVNDEYACLSDIPRIDTPSKLRVMTYNIGHFSYGVSPNGIGSSVYDEKLANYRKFFSKQKCDVLGIEENNKYIDVDNTILSSNVLWNPLYKYSVDGDNGTCIKSKHKLKNTGSGIFTTSNRKYVYGEINIDGKDVFLMVVHLKNQDSSDSPTSEEIRKGEYTEIQSIIQNHERYIVFGDFNARTTEEYSNIAVGDKANGGYLGYRWTYTFSQTDYANYDNPVYPNNIRYFDNILVSDNIVIENSEVLNVYGDLSSDHIPLVADLLI